MIAFFARHPTAANLMMLVFLAAGIFSLRDLRRETFPDFTSSDVEIFIVYPGATAEKVEESICQRVEDALDGVKFIKELRADAREGVAIITVEMDDTGDFQTFKDDINTEVDAIHDFPTEVEDPIITQLGTTELVLALLVSGPMSPPDLKAYCEDLKERLQAEPEVSLVNIRGFSDHQFRIELADHALRRHNLSVADIGDIVSQQSVDLPAGTIETRDRDILVRFVEERQSASELEDLVVVAGFGGAEIRVRDLGRVYDLFELDEDKVLLNGHRAGLLHIEKTKNQDTLRVANAVRAFIKEEQKRQPQIEIEVTQDSSTLVADRLQMLIKNGWQGMVLVFLVMWLFFNLKLSFWVVMSLPVSFLGAFYFLPQFDLTINMLTMVGLLLALGLLMDDGIVIAENIATHATKGKLPLRAAIDGVSEVKGGVFSSFITTICILGPLISLEGDIGKVLRVVPMVLVLVMAVSLVEAFLILPAHLAHSLHHGDSQKISGIRRRFDSFIDGIRERLLGRCIDVLLKWRYLWVGTVVCIFLVSVGMMAGGIVKFQAFPELDGDVVVARVLLPQGTPLKRTEQVIEEVTEGLKRVNQEFVARQPHGQDLVQSVYVQFNQNSDAFENGPHVATVFADLLSAETRNARIDEILQTWRNEVGRPADVLSLVFTEPSFGPAGRPIEIRFRGRDFERLKSAATEMRVWLSQFKGVFNLADDLRPGKQEVRLRLRAGARGLKLNAANMARQLRAAFYGVTADEIQVGPESYEIDVRLGREDQNSLADLEYFHFTLPDGKQVPLSAVAEVETRRGWSRIARVNGMRTVTLRGDIDTRLTNTATIFAELETAFQPALAEKYPRVNVSFEGETKEAATTQGSMRRAMLIGVIGVYVLLSFQFRSYIEPLIVMMAIPFALIGVIWGHLFMGIDISMPSLLGFISLAGVVVNDSILLILFLKMRRQQGADIEQSAAQASRQRFRAIIITSLTTIAGLLPLMAERSLQAQILIPLAVSIAFGLMASTVLVLLVVPCLYMILGDFGLVSELERSAEEVE